MNQNKNPNCYVRMSLRLLENDILLRGWGAFLLSVLAPGVDSWRLEAALEERLRKAFFILCFASWRLWREGQWRRRPSL